MPEHYADDYTMSLIAGTNPNPRVAARWVMPQSVQTEIVAPGDDSDDEVETKVVKAAPRRGRPRANTEAETK